MVYRYIVLWVLSWCCFSPMAAQRINKQQALERASKFLKTKGVRAMPADMNLAYRGNSGKSQDSDTASASYYAFNLPLRQGFVVVSGDTRTDSIIAYSDRGEFTEKNMPDHVKYWMDRYAEQINGIPEIDLSKESKPVASAAPVSNNGGRKIITPLMKTNWDQGSPYYNMCPIYNGKNCVTGCVATAMAQLMYYHQWPQDFTSSIPSFYINQIQMSVSPLEPTLFDWEDMKPKYKLGDDDGKAVATLLAYCGNALEMNYSPLSSAAYTAKISDALCNYFGYGKTVQYIRKKIEGYNESQWEQIIYEELAEGRPVILSGQGARGGHAFVCDGYDGNGLFHINWGWGGYCDGYYRLSVMNPGDNQGIGGNTSNDGYAEDQEAIIGICPPYDRTMEPTAYLTSVFTAVKDGVLTASYSNLNSRRRFFRYGIGIQKTDGSIVPLKTFRSQDVMNENTRISNVKYDLSKLLEKAGNYTIVPISRQENHENWRAGRSVAVATINDAGKIRLKVENKKILKVNAIKVPTDRKVGSKQKVQVHVQNEFDNFSGRLYLFASTDEHKKGKPWSSVRLNVNGGQNAVADFMFRPFSAGTYILWIATDQAGEKVIARSRVNINKALD